MELPGLLRFEMGLGVWRVSLVCGGEPVATYDGAEERQLGDDLMRNRGTK
jgi:hypothetical protein